MGIFLCIFFILLLDFFLFFVFLNNQNIEWCFSSVWDLIRVSISRDDRSGQMLNCSFKIIKSIFIIIIIIIIISFFGSNNQYRQKYRRIFTSIWRLGKDIIWKEGVKVLWKFNFIVVWVFVDTIVIFYCIDAGEILICVLSLDISGFCFLSFVCVRVSFIKCWKG